VMRPRRLPDGWRSGATAPPTFCSKAHGSLPQPAAACTFWSMRRPRAAGSAERAMFSLQTLMVRFLHLIAPEQTSLPFFRRPRTRNSPLSRRRLQRNDRFPSPSTCNQCSIDLWALQRPGDFPSPLQS
jgi:hypothetical protein